MQGAATIHKAEGVRQQMSSPAGEIPCQLRFCWGAAGAGGSCQCAPLATHSRLSPYPEGFVSYLLIAFIIAVVISPLLWLQLSPAQARATAFRQRARELGLRVQLVADIDAEDQDRRPGTVRYLRPYQVTTTAAQRDKVGSWTLMRNHRRGWDS